jgi:small conductance mechanosensitive channel
VIPSLPDWANRLLVVALVIGIAFITQRLLRRMVERWAAAPVGGLDLVRERRRQTAVAVVSSTLRYFVILVAAFVLIGFLLRDLVTAAAGATLVVALVGFGAQRFLQDVIAGIFVLVENQYGVGDFVTLEPTLLSGVVEEVGLRTTILRNLNGDRYIVPNGQIIGVRRMTRRYRTYSVDLLTRKPEDVGEALHDLVSIAPVGAARFLRTPDVIEQRELHSGVTLVRIRADVPPTMEWLVEQFLAKLLASQLQDSLVTEPLVYTLDEDAIRRYERTVVLPSTDR